MSFSRKSPGGQKSKGPSSRYSNVQIQEAGKPGNNENFNSQPREPQYPFLIPSPGRQALYEAQEL